MSKALLCEVIRSLVKENSSDDLGDMFARAAHGDSDSWHVFLDMLEYQNPELREKIQGYGAMAVLSELVGKVKGVQEVGYTTYIARFGELGLSNYQLISFPNDMGVVGLGVSRSSLAVKSRRSHDYFAVRFENTLVRVSPYESYVYYDKPTLAFDDSANYDIGAPTTNRVTYIYPSSFGNGSLWVETASENAYILHSSLDKYDDYEQEQTQAWWTPELYESVKNEYDECTRKARACMKRVQELFNMPMPVSMKWLEDL